MRKPTSRPQPTARPTRPTDLPPIRRSFAESNDDLSTHGVARIQDAVSQEDVAIALDVAETSAREQAARGQTKGGSLVDPNLRVYGLVGKHPVWERMVMAPLVLRAIHQILGDRIILFSAQYFSVRAGGSSLVHIDQMHFDPPVNVPGVASAIIMLDEFTPENGATWVLPGSHLEDPSFSTPELHQSRLDRAVQATGPSGTALVFGGLLQHAVGVNRSPQPRRSLVIHYCLPWIKPFENFGTFIDAHERANMSSDLRALLAISETPFGIMPGLERRS